MRPAAGTPTARARCTLRMGGRCTGRAFGTKRWDGSWLPYTGRPAANPRGIGFPDSPRFRTPAGPRPQAMADVDFPNVIIISNNEIDWPE